MSPFSFNGTSANSTGQLELLPFGVVAFAPFLFLELAAAGVSNTILLALLIPACIKNLNSYVNIYLFSLAIGGLIGTVNIYCLLSLVVARRWVLGPVMCGVNFCLLVAYSLFFLLIYLVISCDKLKGVKNPLHGRPTNKRAYINTILIWGASATLGIIAIVWGLSDISGVSSHDQRGNLICFGISTRPEDRRNRFIYLSVAVIILWVFSSIVVIVAFSNFAHILLELQKLKRLRLLFVKESRIKRVVTINGQDKPLYLTEEERTAKSLTLIYFIHFVGDFISYGIYYIQFVINNFTSPLENQDSFEQQKSVYLIIALILHFLNCVNPVLLILANKRLRIRVMGLFKCQLNPKMEETQDHNLNQRPKKRKRAFLSKTNIIKPL